MTATRLRFLEMDDGSFSLDGAGVLQLANLVALRLRDSDNTHALQIVAGSNLTADRTLTITSGDTNRTLTLDGTAALLAGDIRLHGTSHAQNSEQWYQLSTKLHGTAWTGAPDYLRIVVTGAGYTLPAGRTEYLIGSRGGLHVRRRDWFGGATDHTLKIYADDSQADSSFTRYCVGIRCGNAANNRALYATAELVRLQKLLPWTASTEPSTGWTLASPTLDSQPGTVAIKLATSSSWANGASLTLTHQTDADFVRDVQVSHETGSPARREPLVHGSAFSVRFDDGANANATTKTTVTNTSGSTLTNVRALVRVPCYWLT